MTNEEVLAEIKSGVEMDEIFNLPQIVKQAFDMAKDKIKNKNQEGDTFVNRFEFRLMLVYLKRYF